MASSGIGAMKTIKTFVRVDSTSPDTVYERLVQPYYKYLLFCVGPATCSKLLKVKLKRLQSRELRRAAKDLTDASHDMRSADLNCLSIVGYT